MFPFCCDFMVTTPKSPFKEFEHNYHHSITSLFVGSCWILKRGLQHILACGFWPCMSKLWNLKVFNIDLSKTDPRCFMTKSCSYHTRISRGCFWIRITIRCTYHISKCKVDRLTPTVLLDGCCEIMKVVNKMCCKGLYGIESIFDQLLDELFQLHSATRSRDDRKVSWPLVLIWYYQTNCSVSVSGTVFNLSMHKTRFEHHKIWAAGKISRKLSEL